MGDRLAARPAHTTPLDKPPGIGDNPLQPTGRTRRMSERTDEVRRLLDEGRTVREISQAMGITTQRVYQHLKRLGVPAPTKREPARTAEEVSTGTP